MHPALVVYGPTAAPEWLPFPIASTSAIDELNTLFAAGWYIPNSGKTPRDYLLFVVTNQSPAVPALGDNGGYLAMLSKGSAHRQFALLFARNMKGYFDLALLPSTLDVGGDRWRPNILVTLPGKAGILIAERERRET